MSREDDLNNFTDPIGLIRRMLTSGNKAAYAALFREGLRLGAIPFDFGLKYFEERRLTKEVTAQHPQVLIVGAPRSGTTLVYQALAAFLNVSCPTNLTAMFPKSSLTAARLHSRLPTSQRPDFSNFYGQTTRLNGPNDAFHLWNRWLGSDRYLPADSISEATARDMNQFLTAWTVAFDKPFLNKNNRNAFAIELLAQHLPNASFVVVRRNPMYVAQSLIIARQNVQGDKTKGWGLQSTSSGASDDPLSYVDDVCRQIVSIDTEMNRQLGTVAAERIVEITYEGFCEDPTYSIRQVASKIAGLERNPRLSLDDLPAFEVSSKLTISTEEQSRIQAFFAAVPCPA
jgi:hypothetical protein